MAYCCRHLDKLFLMDFAEVQAEVIKIANGPGVNKNIDDAPILGSYACLMTCPSFPLVLNE